MAGPSSSSASPLQGHLLLVPSGHPAGRELGTAQAGGSWPALGYGVGMAERLTPGLSSLEGCSLGTFLQLTRAAWGLGRAWRRLWQWDTPKAAEGLVVRTANTWAQKVMGQGVGGWWKRAGVALGWGWGR